MKITKIVLTGGPCGGKTTALPHIVDRLRSLGLNVFTVPEAATLLFTNGIDPTKVDVIELQLAIIDLQVQLEDTFVDIAKNSNKDSVIIVDRGILDNRAFSSDSEWEVIIGRFNSNTIDLRDKRYDAVIHMVTAAKGVPQHYNLNNPARRETPAEAAALDDKIISAWTGHPHLRIIDNSTEFKEKIDRAIAAICSVIGKPQPLEIERKFIVESVDSVIPVPHANIDIEQIYLNDGSRIRKRGQNGTFIYTHTHKELISYGVRIETERQISAREYFELARNQKPDTSKIHKIRTCFVWKNRYFELDNIFIPKCLKLLEIELDSIDEVVEFPPFIKLGAEVTDDKQYSNSNIAKG